MSIEEAQKVIEKYAPAKKPDEELPVALVELHEKIQAKQDEKAQEYLASIPVDEDGCYDFSHGTTDELPELTEQDENCGAYIRLAELFRKVYKKTAAEPFPAAVLNCDLH